MKTVKQTVIILLIVLLVANIGSYFYLGLSDRSDGPKISCPEGVLDVHTTDSESVLLQGVTAKDDQDGDISNQVIIGGISKLISSNTAKVTYLVFDSDDNMASHVRYIRYVDYHRPTFEVTEPLVYASSEEVVMLPRLKAIDVVDGDISQQIRVSTLAATEDPEVFDITLQVTNTMGDTVSQVLPVIQLSGSSALTRPQVLLKDYLIYLETGASFSAKSYLAGVKTAGGTASVSDVEIDGTVDTDTPGTYMVRYTYPDAAGHGVAILTVVVE